VTPAGSQVGVTERFEWALDSIRRQAQVSLTPGRARSLQARLDRASRGTPMELQEAACEALRAARQDATAMNRVINEAEDPRVARDSLHGLYASLRRDAFPRDAIDATPTDPRLLAVLGVIDRGLRCEVCGRYIPAESTMFNAHTCPLAPVSASHQVSAPASMAVVADQLRELVDSTPSDDTQVPDAPVASEGGMEVAQGSSGLSVHPTWLPSHEVVEYEEFQRLYEALDHSRPVPVIDAGVECSVLGLDEDVTFGLELEVDFPDDEYGLRGYPSRQELARLLHEDGLSMFTYPQGWHSVGDGNGSEDERPNGEYGEEPNLWVCEFDRSVDGLGGERGIEVKSPIMRDTPGSWAAVAKVCERVRELGGVVTPRTGMHINIGAHRSLGGVHAEPYQRLLQWVAHFEDTLIRLGHNPASGDRHRGRTYCQPVRVPPAGFRSVADVAEHAWHRSIVNTESVLREGRLTPSSRVEFRFWDGAMDAGRIQAATSVSAGLVELARREDLQPGPVTEQGRHREVLGHQRLSGEAWQASTWQMRELMGALEQVLGVSPERRAQWVRLFGESRWQRPS